MKSSIQSFLTNSFQAGSGSVAKYMQGVRGTVLEVLAKRMPKKEAQYLAQQWGYADEGKVCTLSSPTPPRPTPTAADLNVIAEKSRSKKLEESLQAELQRPREDTLLYHPFFGELIGDLHYKKVYLTSVLNLSRSPVWDKQRVVF